MSEKVWLHEDRVSLFTAGTAQVLVAGGYLAKNYFHQATNAILNYGLSAVAKVRLMSKSTKHKKVGQARAQKKLELVCVAFAKIIQRLRARRRWSIKKLALRSGVSPQMISYIEQVKRRATLPVIQALSTAFHVCLGDMMSLVDKLEIELVKLESA
ncbi:MAG: helix-turn-helix transcriptional regulator [Prosthecobacter sp.]